jgi:hypothetical protein
MKRKEAEPRDMGGLLRARRNRPSGSRTAEQRDELTSPHGLCAPQTGGRTLPHHYAKTLLCITAKLIAEWQIWVICNVLSVRQPCPLLTRKRPNRRITAIDVDCVVEMGSADKIRRPELGYQFRSPVICADRLELSGLSRCSARLGRSTCLDIDCLGRPYGLSGLLDRKI